MRNRPRIVKVEVLYDKRTRKELWGVTHYASGQLINFHFPIPKTVLKFIQDHDYKWSEEPVYFKKTYEVSHDQLQKSSH